jgi:hypothetical protein
VNLTNIDLHDAATPPQSPSQMITMLRKCAMVIHLLVWSVCYGEPNGVSRREDCVCVVRGGPIHSMPRVRCARALTCGAIEGEHVRV